MTNATFTTPRSATETNTSVQAGWLGIPLDRPNMCPTLGWVARSVLNVDQPPDIPQRPMGSIPVVIRLVRPDGEEWWPATARRKAPVAPDQAERGATASSNGSSSRSTPSRPTTLAGRNRGPPGPRWSAKRAAARRRYAGAPASTPARTSASRPSRPTVGHRGRKHEVRGPWVDGRRDQLSGDSSWPAGGSPE